jgi:ATP-dependent Clp protease protease subunit
MSVSKDEHTILEESRIPQVQDKAILLIAGSIDQQHLGICIELLSFHYKEDFNEPITLLINSPGGSCSVGWAIIDTMDFIRLPVNTVCIGQAASMAADIFVNGDHRTMGFKSNLMVHSHSNLIGGTHNKLIASLKGDELEHNRRVDHYCRNSKIKTIAKVQKTFFSTPGEDLYLTPAECLKLGLTDDVTKPKDRNR